MIDKAAELLISTEKLLVLSGEELVISLQDKYSNSFKDSPEGLYVPFQIEPLLKPNHLYMVDGEPLYLNKIDSSTVLDDLEIPLSATISDKAFRTIITPAMRKKYADMFTVTPSINPHILEAIKHMAHVHINCMLAYTLSSNPIDDLYKYLTPEGIVKFEDGVLEEACDDIFAQISNFMLDNPWNIYFISLRGWDIFIEMSVDFRIYEWTKHHDSWDKSKRR